MSQTHRILDQEVGLMDLQLDTSLAKGYKNRSQIIRRLTEAWVGDNMFCPRCGNNKIKNYENNQPVADFYCPFCNSQYELKSKSGNITNKIMDGAYDTMISRITGNTNPDFFFLSYARTVNRVDNFVVVPKYFFVPSIIEKRKPLSSTARRAGWIGCNILLNSIPRQGVISIISNGNIVNKNDVIDKLNHVRVLEGDNLETRGWLFDVLNCVNAIKSKEFTLEEIYSFDKLLTQKHPNNNNIRAKIRQQLQILRDKGFIEFSGRGKYKKYGMEVEER